MMDYVGRTVGAYRLVSQLGKGSFASVYLGEDPQTKQQVAIKIFNDENNFPEIKDEAERMARLGGHPHIVQVLPIAYDQQNTPIYVERDPFGRLFLIMQFAPNGTLRRIMRPGRPFLLPVVVAYIGQIASALQALHDAGMIHRDVKPTNILFNQDNNLLLTDFGIARDILPGGFHHTLNITGTMGYMGPEQVSGNPTASSDQYALAVIAYELLTCRKPIEEEPGANHLYHIEQALNTIPPHPIQWNTSLPPVVDAVIMRGLEKDQRDRFPSVTAFAHDLAEAAQGGNPSWITPGMIASAMQAAAAGKITPGGSSRTVPDLPVVGEAATGGAKVGLCLLNSEIQHVRWFSHGLQLAIITRERTPTTPTGSQRMSAPPGTQPGSPPAQNPGTNATPRPPDTTLHIWNPNQQRPSVSYVLNDGQLSPNGAFVARPVGNTVEVHNLLEKRLVVTHQGHTADVKKIAWSPDNKYIASAGNDHTIRVWDSITGKLLNSIWPGVYPLHGAAVTSVAWSLKGEYIASGDQQGSLQMWNAFTGAKLIDAHQRLSNLSFLEWQSVHKPRYVLLATREDIRLWDTFTNTLRAPYSLERPEPQLVRWSPDGQYLAARTGDDEVTVWTIEEGGESETGLKPVANCKCQSSVHSFTWSPVGGMLAVGEADGVEVWSPQAEVPIFVYGQHIRKVSAVDWSPDGNLIASGGVDKQVHAWKAGDFIPKDDPSPPEIIIQKIRYRAKAIERLLGKPKTQRMLTLAGADALFLPLLVSVLLAPLGLLLAIVLAFPGLALTVYRLWLWRPGNTQPVLGSKLAFLINLLLALLWGSAAWAVGTALVSSRCVLFICALIAFSIGIRLHTRMISTLNNKLRRK